jgi:iron complex transport system ATP-binding protein
MKADAHRHATLNTPEPRTPCALAFAEVTFAYRSAPVVEHVSLTVAPGERVGLLGPNGAGKSTLLRLASGVLRPADGSVRVLGDEVQRISRRAMARRVAVVPQDFTVQFAYTVRQIVEMGRLPYGDIWGGGRAGDREVVAAALATTDTLALAERVYNELSGGERQRVLIALALAQGSPILLLDEPTAHLDIKHQIEVLELLLRLNRERGLTIVAALHDLNLAARYFDRLILFRRRILADGPPAHVLDATLLSGVYETPVRVGILRGEEHLSILPPESGPSVREPRAGDDAPARVHVLAGGGSGELLMRTLADARVPFSAGPLNVGDSDCALAERLALACIAEPPYAAVSPQGVAAARERILLAGVVSVCPMPLGPGNVALIEVALEAARGAQGQEPQGQEPQGQEPQGARVVLLEPGLALAEGVGRASSAESVRAGMRERVAARDFTGRGVALYEALLAAGAVVAGSPAAALAAIEVDASSGA